MLSCEADEKLAEFFDVGWVTTILADTESSLIGVTRVPFRSRWVSTANHLRDRPPRSGHLGRCLPGCDGSHLPYRPRDNCCLRERKPT
jgi:hypothetical protein